VECKNKGDTSNNRGDWDYFKVTQKIREQHTGKTLIQGTAEKQTYCALHTHTHTAGSADVKVQNKFHGRNNITCSTDCKYVTAATMYKIEKRFVLGT